MSSIHFFVHVFLIIKHGYQKWGSKRLLDCLITNDFRRGFSEYLCHISHILLQRCLIRAHSKDIETGFQKWDTEEIRRRFIALTILLDYNHEESVLFVLVFHRKCVTETTVLSFDCPHEFQLNSRVCCDEKIEFASFGNVDVVWNAYLYQ